MTTTGARLFVLDTNVLIHDPSALFRFQEHDLFLPMVVIEELDSAKKGVSEVARAARQVSRFLDELIGTAGRDRIEAGLALPAPRNGRPGAPTPSGRLFLQTHPLAGGIPDLLPGRTPDDSILATTLALRAQHPERPITLVSKDINLRIKARLLGLTAEDYYTDKTLEDVDLLYSGIEPLADDFWEREVDGVDCWQEGDRTFWRVRGAFTARLHPNQCLYQEGGRGFEGLVRRIEDGAAIIEQARDYRGARNAVWGIAARNREQNFAFNLLLDPEVDFVTLTGTAGTGKTLLALASGLVQTMERQRYREVVMTRVTVPVGEDIGFLPGTEEEKMTPWMGALLDNLEVLSETEVGGEWGRAATADLLQKRIKIRSLNFMRGRTFFNRFVIIDEAQNLTPKQMKTLITRAGPGTKMVCLGNITQIDTPYLSETTSGLTYVVDRFKDWPHGGHIILRRGERSRLADVASEWL
ncbi:MAG: PhoH family protein [Gammaproteobacteria bacterium]